MTTTESRPTPDVATSEAEIRRLVDAAVEHQSDVDPFLALHSDDIVLVNLAGRRVIGKAALGVAMTEGLKSRLANRQDAQRDPGHHVHRRRHGCRQLPQARHRRES